MDPLGRSGQGGADGVEGAKEADVEEVVCLLGRVVAERYPQEFVAGGVDEVVEGAGFGEEQIDGRGGDDVDRQAGDVVGKFGQGLLERVLGAGPDDDLRSGPGGGAGYSPADPAGPTDDQDA